MRVSLPHLGHAVDFVVSMTFFRSAVFAIFAIQSLLTGMCRWPKKAAVLPGNWGVSSLDDHRRMINERRESISNQPGRISTHRSGATVLATRILHELRPRGGNGADIFQSIGASVKKRRGPISRPSHVSSQHHHVSTHVSTLQAYSVTVSLTFAFLLRVPYVPSMVIVDFPVAADPLTVSVNTLVEVVGFVLNVAVTPVGIPLAVRVTS